MEREQVVASGSVRDDPVRAGERARDELSVRVGVARLRGCAVEGDRGGGDVARAVDEELDLSRRRALRAVEVARELVEGVIPP